MSLASLEVSLSANTAKFQSDMGKAVHQAQRAANDIKRALGAIGAGLSAAVFADFVKGAIDTGDRMNDLRTRTGLLGQELLTLEGAAVRGGSSLEAISDVTSKLGKRLGAAEIGTGEAANAFAAMGISVTNASGGLKTIGEILRESGEKFKGYEDGAAKATLATAAFGRGGDKLIPVIEGIADVDARFKRLGITIGEDFLTQSDKFKDTMSDIKSLNDVLARQIATAFLPYLQKLADVMVTMASNTEAMKTKVDAVILPLKTMATGMLVLFETTSAAGEKLFGLGAALKELGKGNIFNAFAEWSIGTEKAEKRLAGLAATVAKFWEDAKPPHILSDIDNWDLMGKKAAPKMRDLKSEVAAAKAAQDAIKKLLAEGQKGWVAYADAVFAAADAENIALGAGESFSQWADKLKEKTLDNIDVTRAFNREMADLATLVKVGYLTIEQFNAAAMDPRLRNLLTPMKTDMDLLNEALKEGDITLEKYKEVVARINPKMKDVTDEMTEFWKSAAKNMQSAMSDFFFDVMQGNLSDLAGNFKRTIDRMVANVLAAKAATALFGKDFGDNGSNVGGLVGKAAAWIGGMFGGGAINNGNAEGALIGAFATGTDFVPRTGLAVVHQGEAIISAAENVQGGRGVVINMNVNTPDANSFRASRGQIIADMSLALAGARRNL